MLPSASDLAYRREERPAADCAVAFPFAGGARALGPVRWWGWRWVSSSPACPVGRPLPGLPAPLSAALRGLCAPDGAGEARWFSSATPTSSSWGAISWAGSSPLVVASGAVPSRRARRWPVSVGAAYAGGKVRGGNSSSRPSPCSACASEGGDCGCSRWRWCLRCRAASPACR